MFDPPDGTPKAGGSGNDLSGGMLDYLTVVAVGGLSQGFTASRSQAWTVNGFGFTPNQMQNYNSSYATVATATFNRQ
jgi:hypothetical protein